MGTGEIEKNLTSREPWPLNPKRSLSFDALSVVAQHKGAAAVAICDFCRGDSVGFCAWRSLLDASYGRRSGRRDCSIEKQ